MFEFDNIQDLFTPELYWENPYNMLRLPVCASARDIRRRRDDVEAARFDGTLATFMSCLVPRDFKLSEEAIRDLFESLKDVPKRFFYQFFWLWPIAGIDAPNDEYIAAISSGAPDGRVKALRYWSELADGDGIKAAIAKHNLAVMYHLIALLYERFYDGEASSVTVEDCDRYWNGCIKYWDSIADDDTFWDYLTSHVRNLDDPQLTTGMVRRFRHDFPFGFDQINAELLKRYVEQNAEEDVKRHLRYMNTSQAELDDVSESLEGAVQAILRKAQLYSDKTYNCIDTVPAMALQKAKDVLSTARKLLAVARTLENDSTLNVGKIADDLALLALDCQIAYANTTKDWSPCIAVLEAALGIAQGDKAKTRIRENLDILHKNVNESTLKDKLTLFYSAPDFDAIYKQIESSPKLGLENAITLLKIVDRKISEAKGLCPHVNPNEYTNEFVRLVLTCLIQYGNETKDWSACTDPLKQILGIATDQQLKDRILNNIDIVAKNTERKNKRETCWVCKSRMYDPKCSPTIKMAGDVTWETLPNGDRRKKWRVVDITVPYCTHCAQERRKRVEQLQSQIDSYKANIQELKTRSFVWNKSKKIEQMKHEIWSLEYEINKMERQEDSPEIKKLMDQDYGFGDTPPPSMHFMGRSLALRHRYE